MNAPAGAPPDDPGVRIDWNLSVLAPGRGQMVVSTGPLAVSLLVDAEQLEVLIRLFRDFQRKLDSRIVTPGPGPISAGRPQVFHRPDSRRKP